MNLKSSRGTILKRCGLIDPTADPSYDLVAGFIEYAEGIHELREVMPVIINSLENNVSDVTSHVDFMARINQDTTTFSIYKRPDVVPQTIPTSDFKSILDEFFDFHNKPPLEGSKA
ncbi:MAG: hypothetical protein ABIS69_11660 [Sediminibacterium sp.]